MVLSDFVGKKYKLESNENFDDYMKALGINFFGRKIAGAVVPVVQLSKEGDTYTITSGNAVKTFVISFKIGEAFDHETPDGRKVKSTIMLEGEDTLMEDQEGGGKSIKIVREFSPAELKMTMTLDSVVCTRIFKLVE